MLPETIFVCYPTYMGTFIIVGLFDIFYGPLIPVIWLFWLSPKPQTDLLSQIAKKVLIPLNIEVIADPNLYIFLGI